MPFSLLVQSYPQEDVPVAHVQGNILHAMFFHLLDQVDKKLVDRLHEDNRYRPFTLSPLALHEDVDHFHGAAWLPRDRMLKQGTSTAFRITFLDDTLFPAFSQSMLNMRSPEVRLGGTMFTITNILTSTRVDNRWSRFTSYPDLIQHASKVQRKIMLHFLTPTTFGFGNVDLPLPLPRLVFQSYQRRFQEFCGMVFPPDFAEQVELYTAVSYFHRLSTQTIPTKKVNMIGFTGKVTFNIHQKAEPELVFQMNLLADFAFFCGTGKKTAFGMGQTVRSD